MSGWWALNGDKSHSSLSIDVEGENNSELMERFGITSGIQKAPFISWKVSLEGTVLQVQMTNSSTATLKTKLASCFRLDGAARLLGLFSLDSIIRKMQLDF
ncbi:hypothetical protein O9929_01765 [Vibrio lentus]|nr:hypothetical protein [Vibrio lentus]